MDFHGLLAGPGISWPLPPLASFPYIILVARLARPAGRPASRPAGLRSRYLFFFGASGLRSRYLFFFGTPGLRGRYLFFFLRSPSPEGRYLIFFRIRARNCHHLIF